MENLEEFKEIMGSMDDLFLKLSTQGASKYQRNLMGEIMEQMSRKRYEMEAAQRNSSNDSSTPPYCCKLENPN